jgi:hypothetical protein
VLSISRATDRQPISQQHQQPAKLSSRTAKQPCSINYTVQKLTVQDVAAQRRAMPLDQRLTFDKDFSPCVGDTVLIACLAHVLRFIVNGDGVDRQSAQAF